jgi:hypothetical protein
MLGLDMRTRKVLVAKLKDRYRRGDKRSKGKLLDEFVALTDYSRCYARRVLREGHKGNRVGSFERHLKGDQGGRKKYTCEVLGALKKTWGILNFPCGKRLVAIMQEVIGVLEKWGELRCTKDVKALLSEMSASTADRLLRCEKGVQDLENALGEVISRGHRLFGEGPG